MPADCRASQLARSKHFGDGLMAAADAAGISGQSARKWLCRFGQGGEKSLKDRSGRGAHAVSRCRTCFAYRAARPLAHADAAHCLVVGRQRRCGKPAASPLGLPGLKALDPVEPVVGHEPEGPGELLQDNGSACRSRLFARTCEALGHQAHLHQALPAAVQRQGRTFATDLPASMGLWAHMEQQRRTH
jgi:hypothetical protein